MRPHCIRGIVVEVVVEVVVVDVEVVVVVGFKHSRLQYGMMYLPAGGQSNSPVKQHWL